MRLQVFMLSSEDRLDERTMQAILLSGHSRIPVYREGNRCGQGYGRCCLAIAQLPKHSMKLCLSFVLFIIVSTGFVCWQCSALNSECVAVLPEAQPWICVLTLPPCTCLSVGSAVHVPYPQ